MIERAELWIVISVLAVGSFGLRFAFLGLIGGREMPEWVLRHLRYTAVAVLPALVAPMVVWPAATGGDPDPARATAAIVTFVVGMWSRNLLVAVFCGAATLAGMLWLGA